MRVMRGDLVTLAINGDFGKPRPALVMQDDAFAELPSVTVLPLTSELRAAPLLRIDVAPDHATGLRVASQIMVDKTQSVLRTRIGGRIGRIDDATLARASFALGRFLGLA